MPDPDAPGAIQSVYADALEQARAEVTEEMRTAARAAPRTVRFLTEADYQRAAALLAEAGIPHH